MERHTQQRSLPNLLDSATFEPPASRPTERGGRPRSLAGRRVQAKVYEGARAPAARPPARNPAGGSRGAQARWRPCGEAQHCPKEQTVQKPSEQSESEAPLDSVILQCVDSFVSELISDAVVEDDDIVFQEYYVDSGDELEAEAEEEEKAEMEREKEEEAESLEAKVKRTEALLRDAVMREMEAVLQEQDAREEEAEAKAMLEATERALEDLCEANEKACSANAANPQEPSPLQYAVFDYEEDVYSLDGDADEEDDEEEAFQYVQMAYSYARTATHTGLQHEADLSEAEEEDGDENVQVVEQEEEEEVLPVTMVQAPKQEAQPKLEELPKAPYHLRPSVGSWLQLPPPPLPEPEREAPPAPAPVAAPQAAVQRAASPALQVAPAPAASEVKAVAPAPPAAPVRPARAPKAAARLPPPPASHPEVDEMLAEEQRHQDREEEDASKLVAEFLQEQAAEQRQAAPTRPPTAPGPRASGAAAKERLAEGGVAPGRLRPATSAPTVGEREAPQPARAPEPAPADLRKTAEPPKHSRRRTIIGAVVRDAADVQQRAEDPSLPKSPSWALPTAPAPQPPSTAAARRPVYCQGSAAGTVRQARQIFATSQKDLGTAFRMDSDTEDSSSRAAKRQPSIAAAYDALGAEVYSLDQRGAEDSDTPLSPSASRLQRVPSSADPKFGLSAKQSGRLTHRGEARSSALSRAASSMVLDGVAASPQQGAGPRRASLPNSAGGGRRSRVQLWATPSAMAMDLGDAAPPGTAVPASSREELARVSSLGPLAKSKQPTAMLSSLSRPGLSEWSVGSTSTAGRRWAAAGPGAAF